MPEQTPAKSETSPNEFDFVASDVKTPRLKRRSLKAKPPGASENNPSASAATPPAAAHQPAPATGYQRPASTNSYQPPRSPSQPSTVASSSAGTLYYSHSQKEKEIPMKTTPLASAVPLSATVRPNTAPAARPHSISPTTSPSASPARPMPTSSSIPSSSAARPTSTATSSASARPATVSSVGPAARPASTVDYRGNIERQSREQKSIGGILNLLVYALIGLFVIGGILAGYGAHVIFKQVHQQSVTMSDLDSRYAAQNEALTAQLKSTQDELVQVQTLASRQQDVMVHQQDSINKLLVASEDTTRNLAQERAARAEESATRASETAALRARVRSLEGKTQSIFRP